MWEMGGEIERNTQATLFTDEQKEIYPSLSNHSNQEATSDTLGHVVVSE